MSKAAATSCRHHSGIPVDETAFAAFAPSRFLNPQGDTVGGASLMQYSPYRLHVQVRSLADAVAVHGELLVPGSGYKHETGTSVA